MTRSVRRDRPTRQRAGLQKARTHSRSCARFVGRKACDRWALVTNDPRRRREYAQRMWIEEAFRDLKSHGWQVEASSLTDPERMARLWIVLVVAYAWLLLLGRAVAARSRRSAQAPPDGTSVRRWSLFGKAGKLFSLPPLGNMSSHCVERGSQAKRGGVRLRNGRLHPAM